MHCGKACEILADKSARFVQFRKVLFAMEGNADANGWTSENSLRARLPPRVKEYCRMQDTTTYLRLLRSVTACSCPRKGLPQNCARGRKRLRLVKSTGTDSYGVRPYRLQRTGGVPHVERLGLRPK